MSRARISKFGFPVRRIPSTVTHAFFTPSAGYTELPDILAPAGSITSAKNVWVRDGSMLPRWRLAQAGTNKPLADVPIGATIYQDLDGATYEVVMSQDTVAYRQLDDSWTTLTYASGTSNLPPSGAEGDRWRGATIYDADSDLNFGVFTNGVDPLFVWGGPSYSTAYSTLTQSPIAKDVAVFDNRVVAWNIRELSSSSRYVTRVQWHVAGDPKDWAVTSIGAGFEDLLDARGEGTRIFAAEDELILATTREFWRGRRVGLPYVFQFSPIVRSQELGLGIPYPTAAIQLPQGIFWLHSDLKIYRLTGEQITPVSDPVDDTLRRTLADPQKAFFSYNQQLNHLTLYYSVVEGQYPTRAVTLHIDNGGTSWTPHVFTPQLTAAIPMATPVSTSAVTWGGLTGTISSQSLTYQQLLGQQSAGVDLQDGVLTSSGTAAYFSETTSTDLGASVEAYAQTGILLGGDPQRVVFVDQIRVEGRSTSASSLSVALSGNGGATQHASTRIAVSVQSATSQTMFPTAVSGHNHVLQLSSEHTGWYVTRIMTRGRDIGEAV